MDTRFEVLPIGDIVGRIATDVPGPATFTVTASPSRGMGVTVATAIEIARLGHSVVPHVSARLVHDAGHAREILDRLQGAGVGEVFVVGGDATEPVGQYASGADLLSSVPEISERMRVGVPGYPEGHPLITDPELDEALQAKAQYANYVVTQMCFDADAVHSWVARIREFGVALPVYAGVPGPISPLKLLRISAKVGVGESLRVLKSHHGATRLVSPKPWDPTPLVTALASNPEITGLHVYSFNEVAAAYTWHDEGEFR